MVGSVLVVVVLMTNVLGYLPYFPFYLVSSDKFLCLVFQISCVIAKILMTACS